MMAGFTGLSLLKGASELSLPIRKARIALASVAMGWWRLVNAFCRHARAAASNPVLLLILLTTMASALIAILVVGLALLILHFRSRTTETIVASGILVGIGILVMHYLGMSGIRLVTPEYSAIGITFAVIVSVCLSVTTIMIAYRGRTNRNIILGTIGFGIAVFAVHFTAMAGTSFLPVQDSSAGALLISNEALAIGVATAAFIICGGFLLTGATFLPHIPENQEQHPQADEVKNDVLRIPYEKNNRTFFVEPSTIAAIRAEGHYCLLYVEKEKLFCPWSISQVVKRLSKENFIRGPSQLSDQSHTCFRV